ncbi:MAG: hypothetical protein A3C93_05415 [Candidatus Lloydbacteria bacterium RIFCSPHIGHO2_02_FULL_54_17]|uniref:Uncharacterized protein n=1 Tax=Candidatus Lloydbacteria bacterium RIFCSPHIGHO2_02_FULL_54_17 TaxID=1798664 RepID=A0A1G2DGK5_9BACT|nr:MAG: hypothetical protein A3C93_05415 [Candidatus Lloydbacteria bacterium RIFCSPHIGHO2_02_FULL_54_17]OGZ13338.1 MAG: hypothetical protein A2948_04125 [Candidatus Lloydbacteria bacterium RIFCSPLOWO2_01_FULL_54_18]
MEKAICLAIEKTHGISRGTPEAWLTASNAKTLLHSSIIAYRHAKNGAVSGKCGQDSTAPRKDRTDGQVYIDLLFYV